MKPRIIRTLAELAALDPGYLELAREFAAARVLHAPIGAPDSDDPPTINDESLTEEP